MPLEYKNSCLDNGCNENAECISVQTNSYNCTCKPGFTGDGITCAGTNKIILLYIIKINLFLIFFVLQTLTNAKSQNSVTRELIVQIFLVDFHVDSVLKGTFMVQIQFFVYVRFLFFNCVFHITSFLNNFF